MNHKHHPAKNNLDYERGVIDGMQKQMQSNVDKAVRKMSQPEPEAEAVAWRFDQAKYRENDLRGRQWVFNVFSQTKPYMDEMVRNVTPLYRDPTPCQTCEALARTVMMDQTSHDTAAPQRDTEEPAAELRRLHALNAELVEALKMVIRGVPDTWEGVKQAKAALAKADGK